MTTRDELIELVNELSREAKWIDDVYVADLMDQATTILREMAEDNFALAAGQCIVDNGLLGDDHGHQYCALQRKLADGTAPAQRNLTVPEEKVIDAALFSGSKLVGKRNLGWKCPTCGRGNAPFTTTCPCIPEKR